MDKIQYELVDNVLTPEDFVDGVDTIVEITQYGIRPIALGCHKDNHEAAKFYVKHGFVKTEAMEGNDYYYLRYPAMYR